MATRFYFAGSTASGVSPAFDPSWGGTVGAIRRQLLADKLAESLVLVQSGAVSSDHLGIQFVSSPLAAQTISGTVKGYIRCHDGEFVGDVTTRLSIRVVSGDGGTVRGTLLALGGHGTGLAYASHRNRSLADGDALSSLAVDAGDLLVVEIGHNSAGGESMEFTSGAPLGSDLPENETDISTNAPWIEFSGAITFESVPAGVPSGLALLGVGQ